MSSLTGSLARGEIGVVGIRTTGRGRTREILLGGLLASLFLCNARIDGVADALGKLLVVDNFGCR